MIYKMIYKIIYMENNYKEKYLKYKIKYFELKKSMEKITKELFIKDYGCVISLEYLKNIIIYYIENGDFLVKFTKYKNEDLIKIMGQILRDRPGDLLDLIGRPSNELETVVLPAINNIIVKLTDKVIK